MSELYLVRHAQASFAAESYDELSVVGIDQARLLGKYLDEHDIVFDGIVAGDMQRHRQTLDIMFERHGKANGFETHPGLNEYAFREMMRIYCDANPNEDLVIKLQARPDDRRAYFRLLRCVLTAWSEDQLKGAPESWSTFRRRVTDARAMLHGMAEQCRRILVVSSGGAISTFTGSVLGLSPAHIFELNLQIMNTSITRFYFDPMKISLAQFNAVPHLVGREQTRYLTYS